MMSMTRSILVIACSALAASDAMAQMATHSLTALSTRTSIGSCFEFNSSTNTPDATLTINNNTKGPSPAQVLMGEMDSNLIRVEGQPNSVYRIYLYDCSPAALDAVRATIVAKGSLDENGRAAFLIEPDTFLRGDTFVLRARVTNGSAKTSQLFSGASHVDVVPTMASDIDITLPAGSLADIRGPVMDVDLDAQTVTVGNVVYGMTFKTEFSNGLNSLADLTPGDWIVVDGQFNSFGGFDAKEINVEDAENQVRVAGRVQGIGPAGFAILGLSFYTSSNTTYFDVATGMWTTFDAMELGMAVEVRLPTEGPFPTATIVRLNVPTEPEAEPEPESEEEEELENEDPPSPMPPFCS
jgi:uncharacterized protein DUF5666